jgi:heptosyltransferase-1
MMPVFNNHQTPHILLVKTSSLGDVLHNLPVVSDILHHYPNAQIDWVVEEGFAALPRLHPGVRNIIPVAVRRWRRSLLSASVWREIGNFRKTLAAQRYDYAIDTQGLMKSAVLMRGVKGLRCGFDRDSAREPLASSLYQHVFPVAKGQHAVERNRQLAALALGYKLEDQVDYGIMTPSLSVQAIEKPYAVLLHATSRDEKLWAEESWIALGEYLRGKNLRCVLPWGNAVEQERSHRLARAIPESVVPARLGLREAAAVLGNASAVIGVDTGLAHLAAALGVNTVGIYTQTDPALTGLYGGKRAVNLGNIAQSPDVPSVIDALGL